MDISWFCPVIFLSGNITHFLFGESVLPEILVPVVLRGWGGVLSSLTLLQEFVIRVWPISVTKIHVGMDTSR